MRTVRTLYELCVLTPQPGLSQSQRSSGLYHFEASIVIYLYWILAEKYFNALEVQWASLLTDNQHINAHYDHVIAPYINTFSSFHFLYPSFSMESCFGS